jgi:hypothetical protein
MNDCGKLLVVDNSTAQTVTELLAFAASQVVPAPGREPWEYGWCLREYRHSPAAALPGPEGPVTLSGEGIAAWEKAATILLREKQIRDRWDAEEFWGLLASMTVASLTAGNAIAFFDRNVTLLRTAGPALTVLLVANATWSRPPLTFGDAVVGDAGQEFLDYVNTSAGSRSQVSDATAKSWLAEQVQPRVAKKGSVQPVAIACWTIGQQRLAFNETERHIRNIVDLAMLLEHDLEAHEIYQRGGTNRPGIRGLTLDRGAIERGLVKSARLELAAFQLTAHALSSGRGPHHWHGAEPFPLGKLFDQNYLRDAVQSCLRQDPISNRVRVAARWFSEAHFTIADDDAALALGVAMDALLSGQRSLPGSAMADRFALLAEDPKQRRKKVTAYLDFYAARSSVAHGGRSSKLEREDFLQEYRASVHWAAWRLLALRDTFVPSSEKEVDALFDDLRWGVRAWA